MSPLNRFPRHSHGDRGERPGGHGSRQQFVHIAQRISTSANRRDERAHGKLKLVRTANQDKHECLSLPLA